MIMIDQSKRLSEPVRWTPAGRIAVIVICLGLAAGVIGVGIYAAAGGFSKPKQAGCIELTFASTTGGARLHSCGAAARALCRESDSHPQISTQLREACRREGLPVGGEGPGAGSPAGQ